MTTAETRVIGGGGGWWRVGRVGAEQIADEKDDMELAEGPGASEELSMSVHVSVLMCISSTTQWSQTNTMISYIWGNMHHIRL